MATISNTFYLKHPKSQKESLILFACYFKLEEKRFVYSTGEKISPNHWDFKNHQPLTHGKNRSDFAQAIKKQLNRYSDKFAEIQARCKLIGEDFTSKILRDAFDKEFKKVTGGKDLFFKAYDEFMDFKIKNHEWAKNTIVRYNNIRGILADFQASRNYKLTFNCIDLKFQAEFMDYCFTKRDHKNNTYNRNMTLIKAFLRWALEHGYTYKEDFKKFKKKEIHITQKVALSLVDLQRLMAQEYESKSLEQSRDVFAFACVTGMRYGELKYVNRHTVNGDELHLKEEKDPTKEVRTIPLNELAMFILRKYRFALPLISNQKQNDALKEIFRIADFTHEVECVTTQGKQILRGTIPFYSQVTTHTARRTFVTLMKKKGESDKTIASMTGHKDLKTLNQYYQVDDEAKKEAVKRVFDIKFRPLQKVH